MSAIITENFRRNTAELFLNDINTPPAPSEYYLGIGKQDKWSADESLNSFEIPVPIGSRADELEVLSNLSTLVALNTLDSPAGRVIPAVPWLANNVYKAYSSYNSSCFYPTGPIRPCYVTTQGAIFMCLKAGAGNSANEPTLQSTNKYAPFRLNDDYVWVLIQQAPSVPIIRTNTFTDVRAVALTGTELTDSTAQCGGLVSGFTVVEGGTGYSSSSVFKLRRSDGFSSNTASAVATAVLTSGAVTTVTITNGGSGYTSPPAVTFSASPSGITATGTAVIDGSGVVTSVIINNGGSGYTAAPTVTFDFVADDLTLTATITNGTVTAVSYSGNASTWLKGAVFASVEKVSGPGTNAVIIPTIAPTNGFAHIPAKVMNSWFVGLAVKLDDNIEGDSFYSRYRQISIIKNPTTILSQGEADTLNALKYFTFGDTVTLPESLSVDGSTITDADDNVIGFADHVINTAGNKKIYFHQNSVSGYRELELPPTGSIKINSGGGATTYAYTSINTGEFINDGKAEVLFTENRSFITRAPGQLEELILIIQF